MKLAKTEIAKAKARRTTGTTPAKKTASRKVATKAAATLKAYANHSATQTPFTGIPGGSEVKGALLLGALVASGMAKLNKGNTISTTGKGSKSLLTKLVGPTPYNHHKKTGKFDGNVLTKDGAAFFSMRMDGKAATFNTSRDTVEAVANAMRSGGEVDGVSFSHEVASA